MTAFDEFRRRSPERYRELLAACAGDRDAAEGLFESAFDDGVAKARAVFVEHVKLGAASGDLDLAERCIDDGTPVHEAYLEHVASAGPRGRAQLVQLTYAQMQRARPT